MSVLSAGKLLSAELSVRLSIANESQREVMVRTIVAQIHRRRREALRKKTKVRKNCEIA